MPCAAARCPLPAARCPLAPVAVIRPPPAPVAGPSQNIDNQGETRRFAPHWRQSEDECWRGPEEGGEGGDWTVSLHQQLFVDWKTGTDRVLRPSTKYGARPTLDNP